jgi:hypothetical protein
MITLSPDLPQRPKRLKLDPKFQLCSAQVGDELYPNGIFEFNVSRLWDFVRAHTERFPIEFIAVESIPDFGGSEQLDQATVQRADLSRPILFAEIAPDRFNLIDGHHRVAKARRERIERLPAHRIRCPEHMAFLTSTRGYETYVEYWNSKVSDLRRQEARSRPRPIGPRRRATSVGGLG